MSDAPLIENAPVTDKPKKARKPRKPKAPAAPRVPSTKPKNTLAAWLKARGPNHHAAALQIGKAFQGDLRYAIQAQGELVKARDAVAKAEALWKNAKDVLAACEGYDPLPIFHRLDDLAASIAKAKDDSILHLPATEAKS